MRAGIKAHLLVLIVERSPDARVGVIIVLGCVMELLTMLIVVELFRRVKVHVVLISRIFSISRDGRHVKHRHGRKTQAGTATWRIVRSAIASAAGLQQQDGLRMCYMHHIEANRMRTWASRRSGWNN